jgi:DNA-binding Lrp family transcriptional regulator
MRKITTGIFVLVILIAGCSASFEPELTRIDVQELSKEGMKDREEIIIASNERLKKIQQAFKEIEWSPNTKAEMARKEDVLAKFFIQEKKNMPERIYHYRIWFEGETATIISEKENEGYGRLTEKEQVGILESQFLSEN